MPTILSADLRSAFAKFLNGAELPKSKDPAVPQFRTISVWNPVLSIFSPDEFSKVHSCRIPLGPGTPRSPKFVTEGPGPAAPAARRANSPEVLSVLKTVGAPFSSSLTESNVQYALSVSATCQSAAMRKPRLESSPRSSPVNLLAT